MKKTKSGSFIAIALIAAFFTILVTESCSSEKKCGCGVDLYSRYKRH